MISEVFFYHVGCSIDEWLAIAVAAVAAVAAVG